METIETYSQPCDDSVWQHDRQPKKTLFLLVRTTSDATLDAGSGKASIALMQEQPEERIGSEKDPRCWSNDYYQVII